MQMDSRFRGDDGGGEAEAPRWMVEFFATLILTGSVREALTEAGVDLESAWLLRELSSEFAYYWDRAVHTHKGVAAALARSDDAVDERASVH